MTTTPMLTMPPSSVVPTTIREAMGLADKTAIPCLEGRIKKVMPPKEPDKFGHKQSVLFEDRTGEVWLDLLDAELHMSEADKGQVVRFEPPAGKSGILVNRYFSKKDQCEKVGIKITKSCTYGTPSGAPVQQASPSPVPSTTQPSRGRDLAGAAVATMDARPVAERTLPELALSFAACDRELVLALGEDHPLLANNEERQKMVTTLFIEASKRNIPMSVPKAEAPAKVVDPKTGVAIQDMTPDQLIGVLVRCAPYRGPSEVGLAVKEAAYAAMTGAGVTWEQVYVSYVSGLEHDARVITDALARVKDMKGVSDPFKAVVEDQKTFESLLAEEAAKEAEDDIPF